MDNADFQLLEASWSECQNTCAAIRRQVFVIEQGVSEDDEWDDLDECAKHFIVRVGHPPKTVACARLIELPAQTMKITRMAVLQPYRGKGLGSALLLGMIKQAQQSGCHRLVLDAQLHAQSFYAKAGFEAIGNRFMEAGINHIKMIKEL